MPPRERDLQEWAASRGYEVAWGPVEPLLQRVRADIEALAGSGQLDAGLHRERLGEFKYGEALSFPARTVIMIALERPAHRLTVQAGKERVDLVIPPTYLHHAEIGRQVRDDLAKSVDLPHAASLSAPLKAVAARLGLVSYGRNNITYLPGRGSYHQLVGVVTDAALRPAGDPVGREPATLEACQDCDLCRRACPTGAIGSDRFLLRAHRCGALASESRDPWPGWVPPSFHHCLVGCLLCQEVCPENASRLRWETIDGAPGRPTAPSEVAAVDSGDPVTASALRELAAVGITDGSGVLERNVEALLGRRRRGRPSE